MTRGNPARRDNAQRRWKIALDAGICTCCRKNRPEPGFRTCKDCRQKSRFYTRRSRPKWKKNGALDNEKV